MRLFKLAGHLHDLCKKIHSTHRFLRHCHLFHRHMQFFIVSVILGSLQMLDFIPIILKLHGLAIGSDQAGATFTAAVCLAIGPQEGRSASDPSAQDLH